MTSLLVKPNARYGTVIDITPENAEWSFVGFKVVKLKAQETHEFETNDREFCLVPITGTFDAQLSDSRFDAVGGRENLFDQELTEHLYVPEQETVKLTALDELELALCSAPGGSSLPARRIKKSDQTQSARGQGSNTRYIHDILPETQPAHSLLVVEVFTPAGHWSSYPPTSIVLTISLSNRRWKKPIIIALTHHKASLFNACIPMTDQSTKRWLLRMETVSKYQRDTTQSVQRTVMITIT